MRKTIAEYASDLKDIADQLSQRGDQWDYQANRLYGIAAEWLHQPCCPHCDQPMTCTSLALEAHAPREWVCFPCRNELGQNNGGR